MKTTVASNDASHGRRQRLPVKTKLSLGLGTVAFGIKDQGFSALLMLYYNQVIGLPAAWVGAAIMIAMIVDAIADPLIGHWSDGLRSRWGRRHPFMYASAIPVGVAYFLLWSPPAASHEIQFVYMLLTSICVRVAISFYEIPASALTAELTTDYDERTSLASYRTMFYALGLVGMSIVVFKVFLRPSADFPVGQLNPLGYAHYGWIAASVMLVCVLLSAWGTHNRIPSLRVETAAPNEGLRGLLLGLKTLATDRALTSVLLCAFCFAIMGGLFSTLNTYLYTYFWRFNTDQLSIITGSGIFALFLALMVVTLAKKFGKKRVAIVLYLAALVAIITPVLLALFGLMSTNPATALKWLVLKFVVMSTCILGSLILIMSMVADVGDHFQLRTGRRMEGLMFAALIMINKAVSGTGIFLSGLILSAIGFPEQATPGSVDPLILNHLAWIYLASTGSLCLLAITALGFYPITRQRHQQILDALATARTSAAHAAQPG